MMSKYILLSICIVILTGCGVADRFGAGLKGYSKICIDGVLYYQLTSGATVAYNRDGTIKTCGKNP